MNAAATFSPLAEEVAQVIVNDIDVASGLINVFMELSHWCGAVMSLLLMVGN